MVLIETFDHQGKGIGRINNKIVFVKNTVPGDLVQINILKEKKNYIEASIKKIIKKSKSRISPICPYANECGGCSLMNISYEEQLKYKQEIFKNMVTKYLNQEICVNDIVKSDLELHYRNKIVFQINTDIGFFKEKTNDFIKIDKCYICNDIINNSIDYLKKLPLEKINQITCRAINNKLMIIIDTNNIKINVDCLKNIASSIYIKNNNTYIHIYGTKSEQENIDNLKFNISPDSFFQINLNVTKKVLEKIKEIVGSNQSIIDLYCGTGLIGLYLCKDNNVTGIEINKQAYLDAIKNKEDNNLKKINFICDDSGKGVKNLNLKPNIIIVDPPRNGLNKETIDNIIKFNAKKIIYMSCNPITLVRDLKILSENYEIKEITPFDMFPQTYHCESICVLDKK